MLSSNGETTKVGRRLERRRKLVRYAKKSGEDNINEYTPRLQDKYRKKLFLT